MTHQPTFSLEADDLTVEIARPGSRDEHVATRFSPAAHILQIRYQAHSYLFDRGSPMEFDIGERTVPPGFDGCSPGGCFLKIGVGLLERESDDPYRFAYTYPVRARPDTLVSIEKTRARFVQVLEPGEVPLGYELICDLAVQGNSLRIDYALRNLGEAPVRTEQYLHNFSCFDNAPLSTDYTVSVDYAYEVCDSIGNRLDEPEAGLVRPLDSRTLGFDPSAAEERRKLFFRATEGDARYQWSINNEATGTGMTIEADRPPQISALFVTRDQISPEMNVTSSIEPNATAAWTRRYEFR